MPLLKTQQDKEEFLFWIATLQSGVFEKGTGSLQSYGTNQYCCLGIACACTIPEHNLTKTKDAEIIGNVPVYQPRAPLWLKEVNLDFLGRNGYSLSHLNDTGASHSLIANLLLEAYKEELS